MAQSTGRRETDAGFSFGSGRVLVSTIVVAVLVVWGSLFLTFRQWRRHYRQRAAFGAQYVAGAIDSLAALAVPEGEDPGAWREAIAETHAMLLTLTAANVLDLPRMRELSERVNSLVNRAQSDPKVARGELAAFWGDMEAQAGPIILARHKRPAPLLPRVSIGKSGKTAGP